jgi:hypothetical protein
LSGGFNQNPASMLPGAPRFDHYFYVVPKRRQEVHQTLD